MRIYLLFIINFNQKDRGHAHKGEPVLGEKVLITKECIATYNTHLNFIFKQAFHFCTLAIKLLNGATKLF